MKQVPNSTKQHSQVHLAINLEMFPLQTGIKEKAVVPVIFPSHF
jgi:hypothetical protein